MKGIHVRQQRSVVGLAVQIDIRRVCGLDCGDIFENGRSGLSAGCVCSAGVAVTDRYDPLGSGF